jgi:hypothetical protein
MRSRVIQEIVAWDTIRGRNRGQDLIRVGGRRQTAYSPNNVSVRLPFVFT